MESYGMTYGMNSYKKNTFYSYYFSTGENEMADKPKTLQFSLNLS